MKRSCFTLTELLVVIALITLLTAVLLPLLRSSRQQVKAALCSSNIKQLTFGLLLYETQNQTLPYGFDNTPMKSPPGGYPGNLAYDRTGWWWFNFIEGFYEKSGNERTVVRCPSKQLNDSRLKSNILCGNYGVNRTLCKSFDDRQLHREEFVGAPLCSDDVPYPDRTLLIVDSGYSLISWWHAADVPPVSLGNTIIEDTAYVPDLKINKDRNLWSGQRQDAIDGRHPNRTVNAGFADGHVSRKKADDLFVEKTADDYKNKTPLWAPK